MIGIEFAPEHPVDRLVDLAVCAEEEGFDAAFASSHYFNRDPFVVLDRMAAATDGLRLGPGVVNPYESHPVVLASRMATLQEVSDGRGIFGIGAGDRSALANLGIERERPLRRVLEAMQVGRALWDGETVTHEGTFTARDASLIDPPGSIPVYVGAQGPQMLRMAATHADGVLINASHRRDVEWSIERVEEGLEGRASERGGLDVAVCASVSVDDDEVAARDAARPPVAFIAAGAPEPVVARHDLDSADVKTVRSALERGELRAAFDAVTPAMIEAFSIAGTPETVTERFAAILELADSLVVMSPLGPDLETAIVSAARAARRAQG